MNAFALCTPGLEPFSVTEIQELISVRATSHAPGILRLQTSPEKLCILAYRAQSLSRIGITDLPATASKEQLLKATDIAGFNLAAREYRIHQAGRDIPSDAAYALLRAAGFKKNGRVIDPFCRSGIIAIEAALFASATSPHYYRKDAFAFHSLSEFSGINTHAILEKEDRKTHKTDASILNCSPLMGNLGSAEKNARMAGVNKQISFSRLDTDIMDLKFEQKFDCIVSIPPREQLKQLPTLFKRAAPLLKSHGRIVIGASDPRAIQAAANNFRKLDEYSFPVGTSTLHVLVFGGERPA